MEFDKWMNKRNRIGVSMAVEIAMREAFEAGAKNEREACAKVCAAQATSIKRFDWQHAFAEGVQVCEAAIRARTK